MQWSEHNFPVIDDKVAVRRSEYLGIDEEDNDAYHRIPEPIGLDHHDEWYRLSMPAGIFMYAQLVHLHSVLNSLAHDPNFATNASFALMCSAI